jgi:hypothetical protein
MDHKIKEEKIMELLESKKEQGWTWKEKEEKDKQAVMFFKERINVTGWFQI